MIPTTTNIIIMFIIDFWVAYRKVFMLFRRRVTSRRRSLCADCRRYVPSRIRYVLSVVRYEPSSFVANRRPSHVPIARRYVPCFCYVPIPFVTYRFHPLCTDRYVLSVCVTTRLFLACNILRRQAVNAKFPNAHANQFINNVI